MTKIISDKPAFQGDVMFRRVGQLPSGIEAAKVEGGRYIVAHSETGHHHVIDSRNAQMLIDKTNEFIAYLAVSGDGADVVHERSFDTHETIHLPAGNYEIRRQREYIPEGYRKAAD